MLKKFAVSNFRGFPQKIEWDLSNPSNYTFNSDAIKNGIIKNGIIYGPNGSGKTNFSLAIFDVVNHLTQKMKQADYYSNFAYAGSMWKLVDFEYVFEFDGCEVWYAYAKNQRGQLMNESLKVNGKLVFKREDNHFELDDQQFSMTDASKRELASNVNKISIVNYLISTYPLAEGHYLLKLQEFVNSMLWFRCLKKDEYIGLETGMANIYQYLIQNNLVREFQEFLSKVSGQKYELAVREGDDAHLYCLFSNSTVNYVNFNTIKSTGTEALTLLFYWITKLKNASFVFIDEFDAYYHFKLSLEVCKLLFGLDCQVFTSSHNTYLMTNDLLRPDCNFIISNNKIKPLNECTEKELRFGHNIEKMFRGNAFQV